MVTIPRYQSRVGVPLRGQEFAKQFGPGAGEGFRDIAQLAAAADTVIDGARTLWDLKKAKGAEQRHEIEDQQASLEADEQDIILRADQLERGDRGQLLDSAAIAVAVRQAAEGLSPAARTIFERRIAPRQAAWQAQAHASVMELTQARRETVAVQREVLGVEEYLRHADVDEDLGRLALASAVAQRGERLTAAGLAADAVRVDQQALLVEAETARVARTAARDPERAEQLLGSVGHLLPEATLAALSERIGAGRDRLEAEREMAKAAETGVGLEGLLLEAAALAGGEPGRAEAFRGAAIGAWAQAQRAREARDDAAWSAVADQLTPDSAVTGWTQLEPETWDSLADWQQQAVRDHFETPWREPDPEIETMLKTMAGKDPEGFRGLDLGPLASRLTPARYAYWRGQQIAARAPGWEVRQARFAQDARIVDGVIADLGLDGDQAWAARVAGQQGMDRARLLADGPLSEAALRTACEFDLRELFQPWRKEEKRREAEENAQLDRDQKAWKEAWAWIFKKPDIEQPYIKRWENGLTNGVPNPPKTVGYVPSDDSGVTIGTGVDIGQKGLKELRELKLEPALFDKLKPYLGAKGGAARILLKANPLVLTPEEAETVTKASHAWELNRLNVAFNRDSKIGRFEDMPRDAQTVLFSLFLQHGTSYPKTTAPKLWLAATTGDWAAVENELRYGFPKDEPYDRRPADAQKIRDAILAGRLKLKPGTALKPLPPPTPKPAKRPPPPKAKAPAKPGAKGAPKPGGAPKAAAKTGARAAVKKAP